MSAENGIGTAGRLHAVDEAERPSSGQRANWPKGVIPVPHIKNAPESAPESGHSGRNWRNVSTNIGELVGIGLISAGFWEIYAPAGPIAAGVGLMLISLALSR